MTPEEQDLKDERFYQLAEGSEAGELDQLVHDSFSQKASDLNNSGIKDQVHFLLKEGWSQTDILRELGFAE